MPRPLLPTYPHPPTRRCLPNRCFPCSPPACRQIRADAEESERLKAEIHKTRAQLERLRTEVRGGGIWGCVGVYSVQARVRSLARSLARSLTRLLTHPLSIPPATHPCPPWHPSPAPPPPLQPVVFQSSRDSQTGAPLELPSVHFLCGHSFNLRTLGGGDEAQQCPLCAGEHQKTADLRRSNKASAADKVCACLFGGWVGGGRWVVGAGWGGWAGETERNRAGQRGWDTACCMPARHAEGAVGCDLRTALAVPQVLHNPLHCSELCINH